MFVQMIPNFRPSNLLIAKFMTNWTKIRFRFDEKTEPMRFDANFSLSKNKKGKLFLNELKSSHLHERDKKLFVCRSSILRCCLRNRISFDNPKCSVLKIHFDSEFKVYPGQNWFLVALENRPKVVGKKWCISCLKCLALFSDNQKQFRKSVSHFVSMAMLIF